MAREVIIRHIDDLDHTLEASNVELIGFRGFIYELDLTTAHSDELAELLQPYITAAHEKVKWPKRNAKETPKPPAVRKKATRKRVSSNLTGDERRQAREWGRANGFQVAARGYLNPDLVKAYKKAHHNESQ